ncbi:MAG: T9SS type A sorting domain-containing protein [Armatimonadetes bacterium]|nr:T9SS type A sorting domain-containing protein [Armatimonadota bacterium]
MKKQIIFFILAFVLILSALNSEEVRGLTNKELISEKLEVIGKAQIYSPPIMKTEKTTTDVTRENWLLLDSFDFDSFIQPGKHFGVFFDNIDQTIEMISNFETLVPDAIVAIETAPLWLRPALECTFLQLASDVQQEWAEVINDAWDPYIDEIAYCIAHSSAAYLSSMYSYPEVITENVIYMYIADMHLDYVEIVDYGTSTNDENYYSTTSYWKIDENGNLVQVEVPKEIYYMYLVHHNITDEIPAFIDPDIIENNATHTNNIVAPGDGYFWRNFLFNYSDAGYPLLKDCLTNTTVTWDITGNTPDDAIHTITNWINDSMEFTSNAERPHQPVRIYRKHIGRCGEYADITAAACRSALIPCTSILSYSGDHTWNEFWDEEWTQWEPVNGYINNPLVYENGWGKVFASVFEIKSNGYLTPVTATYSEETATIIIYALDNNGDPIDGAKITLKVPGWDNWGYTDKEGKYTFIVGDNRTFYARMDSEIGNDPINTNEVYEIVTNSVGGQVYTYSMSAVGIMPEVQYSSIPSPNDDVDDYQLVVDFTVPEQVISGAIIMDDLDGTDFNNAIDDGIINFFMTDLVNYAIYSNEQLFDTFNELIGAEDGEVTFDIPVDESWYGFFDNGFGLNNPQYVTGSASLYEYEETSSDDDIVVSSNKLIGNYPNPFNPETTISFSLAEDAKNAKLEIFNIKGQKIKTFPIPNSSLLIPNQIVWDGRDDNENAVSSGVYFYKLQTGNYSAAKKMILLK